MGLGGGLTEVENSSWQVKIPWPAPHNYETLPLQSRFAVSDGEAPWHSEGRCGEDGRAVCAGVWPSLHQGWEEEPGLPQAGGECATPTQ